MARGTGRDTHVGIGALGSRVCRGHIGPWIIPIGRPLDPIPRHRGTATIGRRLPCQSNRLPTGRRRETRRITRHRVTAPIHGRRHRNRGQAPRVLRIDGTDAVMARRGRT